MNKNNNECETRCVTVKSIQKLKANMLNDEVINKTVLNYKILSSPTRLNILYALSKKELCVCEIADLLGFSSSAISHQLRVLRDNNLVKFTREGKKVRYRLSDQHVLILINAAIDHALE